MSAAHAIDCSLGAGIVLNRVPSTSNSASIGCEARGYEVRALYVGRQDVTYETPEGPMREITSAYGALSAMKLWTFRTRSLEPQFGLGLFLKRDDRRHNWRGVPGLYRITAAGEREYFTTHKANTYVPTPVSFSIMAGVRRGNWRLSWRHASNAGLYRPNRGQDLLQLDYAW
jgi:hypothetical protein